MTDSKDLVKIALIDDHTLFRAGLVSLLDRFDDIEVLFESAHGQSFLNQLSETMPDLVMVDLKMPHMPGQALIKEIRLRYPELKVIVLSMHDDESIILNCLKDLQVNAYLMKSTPPKTLYEAILTVHREGFYFTPHISEIMFNGLKKRQAALRSEDKGTGISEREKEVLELICQGNTNSEIAEKLFISKRTAEGHRKKLLEKTGCKNTASLVAFAFQHKMIDL